MAKESKIKTNLKEVREAYGMTQQDLADQVGIRRETTNSPSIVKTTLLNFLAKTLQLKK